MLKNLTLEGREVDIDRLPPLNAVRAFEAAARLGSFIAASQALHVTQPAIGRHVKILEDWLDVRLFNRTSKGVTLTAAGSDYYEAASQALKILADAGSRQSQKAKERWLRILCVPAFASRWLTPRIDDLHKLRPGLKIAIEPNSSFKSIDRQADLGIAFGLPGSFAGVHRVLIRPELFAVCSPTYLASLPHRPTLAELSDCQLIHVDDGACWNSWFAANGLSRQVKAETSHMSNDVVLNQAQRGFGVALATEVVVANELQEGSLVRCVEEAAVMETYYLLTPQHSLSDDAVWFIDWLSSALHEAFPRAIVKE